MKTLCRYCGQFGAGRLACPAIPEGPCEMIEANKCEHCGGKIHTANDPNGMMHGEGLCQITRNVTPPHECEIRFDLQLQVTTHFIVDLAFAHDPRGLSTMRVLRELLTDLIRLHEPDTLSVRLTPRPGETPLFIGDQVTINVVETSSKTGATFPVNVDNLQYAVSDNSIASVEIPLPSNGQPATLTATGVGTATLTVTDSSNQLVGTASITVAASTPTDAPDTLTVTLTPIVAGAALANLAKTRGAKPV